jgi:hypothetical protein
VIAEYIGVALAHALLQLDGAAHSINHARKLDEHSVACCLNNATVVLCDLGVDQLASMRLEPFKRAFLVSAHQA